MIGIIGSGISGISVGKLLNEQNEEVIIFEKKEKPGGLISCDRVEDNLFHKVGGHVFNSKNQAVLDWFWDHFDKENEFIKAKRNAKIWMNNHYLGYPLENYLYLLDSELLPKIIEELLDLNKKPYRDPFAWPHFEAFLKGNFGETLYKLYFKPYNEKIWKTDLNTVPMHWLEGKLPMPDYRQVILSNIIQKEESEMVHSTFFYPRTGGSQFIIDRLSEGLEIHTHTPVNTIKRVKEKWEIEGTQFDHVIYTGDIRKLPEILDNSVLQQRNNATTQHFRSNGTSNVLCYTDTTDMSWLYLPDPELRCHRIIYTGNFSPTNNANQSRPSCVVEFSGKEYKDVMVNDLRKLPGNLEPIVFNYEPNSYVIQDAKTREVVSSLKSKLSPLNFHLLGRFAEWEYYNMDKCIEGGMKLIKFLSIGE
jgi:protoporphyrinogen oxidase